MRRAWLSLMLMCATGLTTAAAQDRSANSLLEPIQKQELGTLRVCLRLQDETPFLGAVAVRVLPEHGYELLGVWDESKGDALFFAVAPGRYTVEVSAETFLSVRLNAEMEPGNREKTLFVVMKLQTAQNDGAAAESLVVPEVRTAPSEQTPVKGAMEWVAPQPTKNKWKRAEWKDDELVDRSVACPAERLLHSAGQRVKEFINSLEKFTATETVEHYMVDKTGERKGPERREFAYVAAVEHDQAGRFALQEYRNGNTDPKQFPANIATIGLPAIVLVFHPDFAEDFDIECDGLVRQQGHAYWQMSFAERLDRPARIESYVINGMSFPIYLEGRAWIDPGKGQVVRMESQLEKPIPEIELWEQHQKINYTGVKFAATRQEIWLPENAEVYAERHKTRYYRRHSFRDFRLFNVDTSQNVQAPKGSYSFTNLTDRDLSGELTVTPVEEMKGGPITLRIEVPAHRTVIKTVGPGKDVSLPAAAVASARFVYAGEPGAVQVDVDLLKETTLDVIPAGALAN